VTSEEVHRLRKVLTLTPVVEGGLRAIGADIRDPEVLAKVRAWGDPEWQQLADAAGVNFPSQTTRDQVIARLLELANSKQLRPGQARRRY
jgi:hypothetical protein